MNYKTKDGEKLDVICFKQYGFTNNSFEKTLFDTKNYDLTSAEVFTSGVTIELPIIQPDKKLTNNSLWE